MCKHPAPGLTQSVRARRRAFTLVELLVVIAIIAILAAILLPVLELAKKKAQGAYCMNSLKQLQTAFKMYDNDDNDYFCLNIRTGQYNDTATGGNWQQPNKNWVAGQENYDGRPDNTNSQLLVSEGQWENCSQFSPYASNPDVYHCPADESKSGPLGSTTGIGNQGPPRVRSYSMSCAVGCTNFNGGPENDFTVLDGLNPSPGPEWRTFNKESTVHGGIGPADLWVLIDENPDSIDDGYFAFQMPFYDQTAWWNCPSKLHENATGMGFEDGHAEIHRWLDPGYIMTTMYEQHVSKAGPAPYNGAIPGGDPDIFWMAQHTTIKGAD